MTPSEPDRLKKAELLTRFAIEELRTALLLTVLLFVTLGYGLSPAHAAIREEAGFYLLLCGEGLLAASAMLIAGRTGRRALHLMDEPYGPYSSRFGRWLLERRMVSIIGSTLGIVLSVLGVVLLALP